MPELDPGLQATGDWEQVYVTFVGCDDRSRNGDYSGIYMAVFVPGEYEENFSPNTQGQLGGGGQFSQGSQIGPGGQNTQQYNPNQQLGTGSNTQQFNPQQQGQFNPNQQQQQQQQGQPASGQFNTNQMQGNQMQGNQNPNAQALGRPTQPNTNQFQPPQQQQGNFAPSQNSQLMQNGQPQPQALGRPAAQLGQQPSNQLAPQNLQQNQPVQQAQAQPNQLVPNSNLQQGSFGSNLQQNTNNQLQPGGQPGTVQQNQFGQNIQQGGTPQSFQQNAVPQQQQPGQQQPSSQFSSNALPQTQQIQPGKPNPNKPLSQAQLRQLPKSLPIGLMKEAGLPTDDQGSSSSSQGLPSQGLQNSQLQQSGSGSGSDSDDNSDPIDPTTGQAASTNWMGDGSSDSGNEFGSGTDVGFGGGSALDWYGWVGWYVEFYECNSDRELHGCNYEGDDNTDLTTFLSVSGASVVTCARAMLTRANSAVTTPTRPTGLRTTIMMRASRTMTRSKLVVAALLSLIQNGKISWSASCAFLEWV